MDLFSEVSAPSLALASGLSLAAGAYLNAKLGISTDLSTIYNERSVANRLSRRIAEMGDTVTIYKLLERNVEIHGHGSTDALWFEGKTWSYIRLKDRKYILALCQLHCC